MSDPLPASVYGLISSIIISGGIAGAIFGFIRDILLKRKEVYLDLAKSKIQSFEKARPYYIQLALYAKYAAATIGKEKDDPSQFVYCLSKMLYMTDELNSKFGGFVMFSNLYADDILSDLFADATSMLELEVQGF